MSQPLPIGSGSDRVSVSLAGERVAICQSYEATSSVLTQPCAFALRLGHSDLARQIFGRYPSNTPFLLEVGGWPQFRGTTDGPSADDGGGGTEVTIKGRDDLKRVTDCDVAEELVLKDVTYPSFVKAVLAHPDVGLGDRLLSTSNAANRKIRAGVRVLSHIEPRTLDEIVENPAAGGTSVQYVVAKVGESWWQLLTSKLKTAGLFLWADTDGNFVLSQPNGQQKPTYRIERWRGKNPNAVNAERSRYRNETARRHAEYVVYSRIGGKKFSRSSLKGRFTDAEMLALGYTNKRVLVDKWVTSPAEAEFLARRTMAEERREGWELTYEVAGHTTRSIAGGMAVWSPDTIVEVRDDEFGLEGLYYLESCDYRASASSSSTTTTLHLMRLSDLVFGADE